MANKKGFTTTILHSDRFLQPEFGAMHQPIHTSVAWGYEDVNELVDVFQNRSRGYAYSRQGNPTVAALENKITQMEQGLSTVAFSTGMAAITASILALLKNGDHIIASSYLFGNSRSIMQTFTEIGIQISFVDVTNVENVKKVFGTNTRMVFVETIANPATQVAHLDEIGCFCLEHQLVYMVDNTMTSPYLFQPVKVKASLIVNSLTKYIGGHGNALGGSITNTGLYDWTNFPNIASVFRDQTPAVLLGIIQIRKRGLRDGGGSLSPEAAHTISVGAETLALRLEKICSNAFTLACFLNEHPGVKKVYYPGLVGHPQHKIASDLFHGYGGLMSFTLNNEIDCFAFLNRLKLVIKSSNLGDTRTLAIPVANTIFYELGAERRKEMGIEDSLIRLSVGIEDSQDLLEDFTQALG